VPRRVVAETSERLGPVDVLVANAGIGTRADLDDVDLIVAVVRNAYLTGQTFSVDGGRYPR
jgi:NADP-dependent 3-hydroxy acid dehydrogenase YdfG